MMTEERTTLTTREIAQLEHLSTDTVKRAIRHGHLRAHQVGSRGDWRIRREDYLDWLSRGAPTSPAKDGED
jgi:excisionase family DNA binding protein